MLENILKQELFFLEDQQFIYDSDNDRFLEPHQELNQFARDFLFVWAPLFDANKEKGSLIVYEKSHLRGYYSHNNDNKLGSSHLKKEIYSKFKNRN